MLPYLLLLSVSVQQATASSSFSITAHLHSTASTDELDALFWRVATPASADYMQFFPDVESLAPKFGAPPESVTQAVRWLRSLNGSNVQTSAMRDRVTATFATSLALDSSAWSARGLPLRHSQPPGVLLVTRRDDAPTPTRAPAQSPSPSSSTPSTTTTTAPRAGYSIANQKAAYKVPADRACTNEKTLQMVWGPGTFGYSPAQLEAFRESECPGLNPAKVHFDTAHHGMPGGDNFGEGTLDVHMISAFGMNASTLVTNTNTSHSTEEGDGFGLALLDFVTELTSRPTVPHVLSLSLGSLSAYSCDLLCTAAAQTGEVGLAECRAYLQKQRQVCMFVSQAQVARINHALMALGLRGVSVLGSSGDGGSHWSFGKFHGFGKLPRVLNKVGCTYNFPIFPSPSPYMVSVGGTDWKRGDPSQPVMWRGSGGGFSWQFAAPAHQRDAVQGYLSAMRANLPPASSYNASGRAYPDIAAVAVDGTSQSSPTFAGLFTLLADARLNAGLPPLGPLGPRIYAVAQRWPGAAFEDVTEGNSRTSCDSGFPAASGWDPTTGWGRPVWPGLLTHFGSDDTLPEMQRR